MTAIFHPSKRNHSFSTQQYYCINIIVQFAVNNNTSWTISAIFLRFFCILWGFQLDGTLAGIRLYE